VDLESQIRLARVLWRSNEILTCLTTNREWDYNYGDVRDGLGMLESVVSEVNKVDREVEARFFLPLRPRTSEMHANPKETSAYSPSDASTG
jgi:hypothetical protein